MRKTLREIKDSRFSRTPGTPPPEGWNASQRSVFFRCCDDQGSP
jgi:hypothetical protein